MKRWEINTWIKGVVVTGVIFLFIPLIAFLVTKKPNPLYYIFPGALAVAIPVTFAICIMQKSDWIKIAMWLGKNINLFL